MLLADDIEVGDYRTIKADMDKKINRSEAELTGTLIPAVNVEPFRGNLHAYASN